jgi:FG-GAP-like repeat/ASPIC and UnbV
LRSVLRICCTGLCCALIAGGVVAWITHPGGAVGLRRISAHPAPIERARETGPDRTHPSPGVATFFDPNARSGSSDRVFLDPFAFDGNVFSATGSLADENREPASLNEYRDVIAARPRRARAVLEERRARLELGAAPSLGQATEAIGLYRDFAFVALYEGDHDAAASWLTKAYELARMPGMPAAIRANMMALLGINALRRGEEDNCIGCVGPSSCIFPIGPDALHTQPAGSREAVRWFMSYLDEWPGDLRIRWLLNVASMTLGEHPRKVPTRFLISSASFGSKVDVGRFENVAGRVGLISRGPDLAGGCIFDDFTGDGRPDVFTTTFDVSHGASFYVNRGDGTFEDRSEAFGLGEQVYALNAVRADYDNDGSPDVLLLRGGWEKPARLSLLRNKEGQAFEDVTVQSGLGESIATESAAWGDYDNDGRLDLFICGEYLPRPGGGAGGALAGEPDPRNRCRLYHNQGNGKFVDVAVAAGVVNERWAKGASWGDYDNDGRLDLFVSNMDGPPRLYRNMGNGIFEDVAPTLGIDGPPHGFTCMFWDYDNDGWLDLFVADYGTSLAEVVADRLNLLKYSDNHAHVYHNLGTGGFQEVSAQLGLARPMPVMSVNAGDIDNDGLLDLYMGTGWMNLSGLVPNAMFLNLGNHFEDVTESSGTGHLQKGHGVSFSDWDSDGDLDLFVVLGGGYPGDRGYNALFRNPGHKRHSIKIKLVGTRTNRSALGAKIVALLKGKDGLRRSIHRVVGNNGSFGGNALTELIGLGESAIVDTLTVSWPTSRTTQTFRNLAADQTIKITEGSSAFEVLDELPIASSPVAVK